MSVLTHMNSVVDCLAFVMTCWMLYCFVRHGLYPAIRFVLRMIGAITCFFVRRLRTDHRDAVTEHLAEVCAPPRMAVQHLQRTDHD
ncbi:hypothetical protein RAS1_17190 [Phycisphaerae bacterium RAS1]|nr:hypothetical protein RAS1_17190 [Phycisphaerae bacterium RAS1]